MSSNHSEEYLNVRYVFCITTPFHVGEDLSILKIDIYILYIRCRRISTFFKYDKYIGHSKTSEAMQYSVEFLSRTKDNRATWTETLSQSGTW